MERIRNVGILAHIDAGKTTTTERMLYYAGRTRSMGEVHDGTTVMDYMVQERERGITIGSAAITFPWREHRINLIDTPGHVDFTIEVERSVRVLDGAVAIVDGVAGVQAQTVTVWKQAERHAVPRLAFVNKMDRTGASVERAVRGLREKLGATALVAQLPVGEAEHFRGLVDLLAMEAVLFPEKTGRTVERAPLEALGEPDLAARARDARAALVEGLAEVDEAVADAFLAADGPLAVPAELLRAGLRRATLAGAATVVLCGSAFKNKGVQPLLDGVVDFLPSPLDRPPVEARPAKAGRGDGAEIVLRRASPSEPLCALAFKVQHDKQRGPLVFLRVYSGSLPDRATVLNVTRGGKERVGRLLQVAANDAEEVAEISAGNIGAAVGLKEVCTGDTLVLASDRKPVELRGIEAPAPVFFCAIEPEATSDEKPLADAIAVLQREDPSFGVATDAETGQTLISGMGELHLDIIRDRLVREHKVNCRVGRVRIAYRETVTASGRARVEYDRTVAGKRLAARLEAEVAPLEPGAGHAVRSEPPPGFHEWDGAAQAAWHEAAEGAERGAREALGRGPLFGFATADVAVVLRGFGPEAREPGAGVAHRACAAQAVGEALGKAQGRLLEPLMRVEVETEAGRVGDVLSDLTNRRRATVLALAPGPGETSLVSAEAPLSEMVGYATALRSLTAGAASFGMSLARYELVPEAAQARILADLRGF